MSNRRRTISLTEDRRKLLGIACTNLGISGQEFITEAIDEHLHRVYGQVYVNHLTNR